MWERFSYYGMRTLLVLDMVKYLLLPGHGGVIGLGAVRDVLESIFGPSACNTSHRRFMVTIPLPDPALWRQACRSSSCLCWRSSRSSLATAPSGPISRPRSAASTRRATIWARCNGSFGAIKFGTLVWLTHLSPGLGDAHFSKRMKEF